MFSPGRVFCLVLFYSLLTYFVWFHFIPRRVFSAVSVGTGCNNARRGFQDRWGGEGLDDEAVLLGLLVMVRPSRRVAIGAGGTLGS